MRPRSRDYPNAPPEKFSDEELDLDVDPLLERTRRELDGF